MPSAIVTSTDRYKRPPRKPQAITGPAIVTPRSRAAPAVVERSVKPGNDNLPDPEPKSRIVQATKPKGRHGH